MTTLSRLAAFAKTPEARPALLGFLGAVMITAGGVGAGSTRLHDPLLESLHLSWLRFGHGLVLSSILLWGGVAVMLIAWLRLGRSVIDGSAREYTMVATTGFWLAPLLLSVPVFSRDTYSYLAQGALLRDGFDPYAVGPVDNPNSLLDNVSPIWTTTTAPYGPAFLVVAKFVTMLVGDHVIAGTMVLRLCMLPGLILLLWAAPRLARHVGANGATALWICALNPLVIIHLMGGVHNEMLMVGLMAAGIALIFQRHPIAGNALIVVAVAVKATAGLALPFMVWVWARQLRDSRGLSPLRAFAAAAAGAIAIFVAVFAVLSALAGVGLGWLTALAGSVKIINWLTVPTAVSNLVNAVGGLFFGVNFYAVLEVARIVGIAIIAISLPAAVVAVSAHRPPGAHRHRAGDGDRGAVRTRSAALVLHLAAGDRGGAGPEQTVHRAHRGILNLDHGDLQTRWQSRHVLMDTRAAGHRLRCGGLVFALQGPGSVRHRLGAAQHFAGLMAVQRVDRPCVVLARRRSVASDRQ